MQHIAIKKIISKGIKNLTYFSKGKRGIIYRGNLGKADVLVKVKNPESRADGRIENEACWLEKLNKKSIGPKMLFHGKGYFCYNFVEGQFISDYFREHDKKDILAVIRKLFRQLHTLDKLHVDKEEMHNPYKHIIISDKKPITPVLIDFERCHKTKKPKNTTQFCQFLARRDTSQLLHKKGIIIDTQKIRAAAQQYKKTYKLSELIYN